MSTTEEVMTERLVRVETKLDILVADLGPRQVQQHEAVAALELRVRTIEVVNAEIKTRIALVAGGTGGAGGIITALIAHFLGS